MGHVEIYADGNNDQFYVDHRATYIDGCVPLSLQSYTFRWQDVGFGESQCCTVDGKMALVGHGAPQVQYNEEKKKRKKKVQGHTAIQVGD